MFKRLLAAALTCTMVLSLSACGGSQQGQQSTTTSEPSRTEQVSTAEPSEAIPESSASRESVSTDSESGEESQTQTETEGGNILIAYFSFSGNTATVANQIQELTEGDLFEIKTVEPYPEYNETLDIAQQEQKDNARPQLSASVENMDNYDVIFVGYPIWWSSAPMAVFTFLEEYNLTGKTVIPFCTHDGSQLGRSVTDITAVLPGSTILDALAVRGSSAVDAKTDVKAWIVGLGISD